MENNDLVDILAEASTIATLIYHPEFLLTDNILKPKFFHEQDNQCFFWAIEELITSGVDHIDAINLGNMINSNNGVKKVMERYNIVNIQDYIERAHGAARDTYEEYRLVAENVVVCAFRRELEKFAKDIGKECHNLDISLDDLNSYVNNGIDNIAQKFVFGSDSILFGEKIDELWEDVESDRNDDGTCGVPLLIPELGKYILLSNGTLTLVAGGTKAGKSAFLMNQALYATKCGITSMIFDSELTDKEFMIRALANLSGVTYRQIKTGRYTNEEGKRVSDAIRWFKDHPFIHQYEPSFSKIRTEQIVRKWKNKNNLGLLIYDYIKPVGGNAAEISQNMGVMTDFLKNNIGGKLEIPVLGGLQLNTRTGDLSDSTKPEKYGDALLFWKAKTVEELRRDTLECGNFKIEVILNRNGAITGEDEYIDINFTGDLMRISEAKKHAPVGQLPFEEGDN